MKEQIFDYSKFRFSKLNTDEFRHLYYLLFWPIFGLFFMFVEFDVIPRTYYVVHCALDDVIPFCEVFLIPYMFWFVFLVGAVMYTGLFDIPTFKKMMKFFIITYGITMLVYFIWPTAQELRPASFERNNLLVRFIKDFYEFDTNTNVCPSLHVVGSFAAMYGFWHTKRFSTRGWHIALAVINFLICISTVFMKQHSILDIPPAILICAIAYPICFKRDSSDRKQEATVR